MSFVNVGKCECMVLSPSFVHLVRENVFLVCFCLQNRCAAVAAVKSSNSSSGCGGGGGASSIQGFPGVLIVVGHFLDFFLWEVDFI